MRLFGLIGKPLSHSFSQRFFSEKFKNEGLEDCQYQNFELENINQLSMIVEGHRNLEGINVTIPFKQEVLQLIDVADEAVQKIGACNCIKISKGKLFGFNTDVVGFQRSLKPLLEPHHKKALILGSGGASRAVQHALTELQIKWTIVSTQS
ncbi:MAG: shikimate dehydrogenase, partial [Chitinophagaceae bacterium]